MIITSIEASGKAAKASRESPRMTTGFWEDSGNRSAIFTFRFRWFTLVYRKKPISGEMDSKNAKKKASCNEADYLRGDPYAIRTRECILERDVS